MHNQATHSITTRQIQCQSLLVKHRGEKPERNHGKSTVCFPFASSLAHTQALGAAPLVFTSQHKQITQHLPAIVSISSYIGKPIIKSVWDRAITRVPWLGQANFHRLYMTLLPLANTLLGQANVHRHYMALLPLANKARLRSIGSIWVCYHQRRTRCKVDQRG